MQDVSAARKLLRDRDHFLSAGNLALAGTQVRQPIRASWQRSMLIGLDPASCEPQPQGPAQPHPDLRDIGGAVLREEASRVEDARVALTLSDKQGRIVRRWTHDKTFTRYLDRRQLLEGNSVAELYAGTTASGIALETGASEIVYGAEHFSESWIELTTAAAPVRNPLSRHRAGAITITCDAKESSPVLLSWARSVAAQIEREWLRKASSSREHLLLEAYLAENHDARHAVVSLDKSTIISNAAAARMLSAQDLAALWERVAQEMEVEGSESTQTVILGDGTKARSRTRISYENEVPVAAVVSLQRVAPRRERDRASARSVTATWQPEAFGHSAPWIRAWSEFAGGRRGAEPTNVLITGPTGTGKSTAAKAILANTPTITIDLASLHAEDARWWQTHLETLDTREVTSVHLEHLEVVQGNPHALPFLIALRDREISIVATATGPGAVGHFGRLGEMFDAVAPLPALSERIGDLPELLATLTRRHTRNGVEPHWTPSAIQMLSRAEWPNNLHTLDALVRRVLSSAGGRVRIDVENLPAEFKARASRRTLTGLEQVESAAIAAALHEAAGNKSIAADILGIARSTLYRKVLALGLDISGSTY